MNLKKEAINGTGWTTCYTIINGIVQIAKIAILTRFLNKSDYGLIALVTLVTGFTALFSDLGIPSAILHKEKITTTHFSSLYWFNLSFNIFLYLLLFLLAPLTSYVFHEKVLLILIPIMGLDLIINSIGRLHLTILQKELHFKIISIINIISCLCGLLSAVFFAYKGLNVYSLIYSTLIQSFISNISLLILGSRLIKIKLEYRYNQIKDFLKVGLYQTGAQVLDYFSNQIDIFIIGKIFGIESLGLYNLAKQLILRPYQIINSIITNVFTPIFSKFQNNKSYLKSTYNSILVLISFINVLIYGVLATFSNEVISILYGVKFLEISPIVAILCVWGLGSAIGNPAGSLTIAKGRTDLNFKWTVLRIFVNPIFIFIGCQFSLKGVAISQAILIIIFYFMYWWMVVYPVIKISLKEYIQCIRTSLIIGSTCFILFNFLQIFLCFSNKYISFTIHLALFTIIYVLLSLLFNKKLKSIISYLFPQFGFYMIK